MASSSKPAGWIDFDIIGNEQGVQRMLDVIDSALSPFGLAAFLHGDVGPYVKQRAKERFDSEGDDVTGKWAPLKETTVTIREGYGFGGEHPINRRTDELRDYITGGSLDVTASPGVGSLRYPGQAPKSPGLREKMKTSQKGRSNPKTVARPVLGLNESDLSVVLTMLAFHVQREGAIFSARGR